MTVRASIEIGDVRGVSFTDDEIATLTTAEHAVKAIRRLFARTLRRKLSDVALTPHAREQVIAAWKARRSQVQ